MSLMSSPRNAPLQDFGKFYGGLQTQQMRQNAIDQDRSDTLASRDAMAQALIASGVSEPEAKALAINPQAAKIRLDQISSEKANAANDRFFSQMPSLDGPSYTGASQPSPESAVTYSGVSDASALPPAAERLQMPQEYGGANVFSERGAAQPAGFNVGGPIADTGYLEAAPAPGPGAEIPLAKPDRGLPATARPGTILQGNDGKTYQYAETTGMAGATGGQGWIEVNPSASGGSAAPNKTVAWLQQNDPEAAALIDQGFSAKDALDIAMVRQKSRKPAQADAGPTQVAQAQTGQGVDLNDLHRKRDTIARYLAQAPSKEAFDKGKMYLDIYDEQIKRATPKEQPSNIREYEYAKSQGFPGSFVDFQLAQKKAGATNVSVGGDGAPGLGKLSSDYGYVLDPETRQPVIDPNTGLPKAAAIPGSPADLAAQAAAKEQDRLNAAKTRSDADKAETTMDATASVLDILKNADTPATGTLSRPFALYSGTPAGKVRSYVSTLQSGVALGAMTRLKEMSSTGATGFGALSEKELDLLISDIGALNPDNTEPEIFQKTVERIQNRSKRIADDIVKNVSPERIQELGLQPFIDSYKGGGGDGLPKVGDVVDGYRFNGGDPASPTSWDKTE
ncbi:hypothetical protein [Mesorhizobium sp. A556]